MLNRLRYVLLGCAGAAALVLVSAGGAGCDLIGGCDTDTPTQPADRLAPGQSLVLTDVNCTTGANCAHATIEATWKSSATGQVTLEVHGVCPDYFAFIGNSASQQADASVGSIAAFEAINNKSPCGVSVRETYVATLTNGSNGDLVTPLIKLVCPKMVPTTNPLMPTPTVR